MGSHMIFIWCFYTVFNKRLYGENYIMNFWVFNSVYNINTLKVIISSMGKQGIKILQPEILLILLYTILLTYYN